MIKNILIASFVLGIIIIFACQGKLDSDKDIVTTVSGSITYLSRPAPRTVITAGEQTTISDASGDYSITVFHEGAFDFKADFGAGKYVYTEKVNTEENKYIKNVSF